MKELIYLCIYFFSYSAACVCVVVCVFSLLRGGPDWLVPFIGWLFSAVLFLLLRNVVFFLKEYKGMGDIESSLPFYLVYMVTSALFLGFLTYNGALFVRRCHRAVAALVSAVEAGIPLVFIPLLFLMEGAFPNPGLRRTLLSAVMYYSFYAVIADLVFLFINLSRIADPFVKSLVKANLLAGLSYAILGPLQWLVVYRNELYSVDPFCIVNVNLFLMFLCSTIVIGKEYLVEKRKKLPSAPSEQVLRRLASVEPRMYPKCSEEESRIVALIEQGATNGEIAAALGISLSRVKNAIYRVFCRFGVNSRTELVTVLKNETPFNPLAAESAASDDKGRTARRGS